MNVDELRLSMAIKKACLGAGDRPTSDQRKDAAKRVMIEFLDIFDESYFPYTVDEIETAALRLRKSKEMQIKVDIAFAHGWKCFWNGRGVGPCSDEIEAGHIIPKCEGGQLSVENCWIECRAHNNERRERHIERYMRNKFEQFSFAKESTDGRRLD
jgi:hypothetical protein